MSDSICIKHGTGLAKSYCPYCEIDILSDKLDKAHEEITRYKIYEEFIPPITCSDCCSLVKAQSKELQETRNLVGHYQHLAGACSEIRQIQEAEARTEAAEARNKELEAALSLTEALLQYEREKNLRVEKSLGEARKLTVGGREW